MKLNYRVYFEQDLLDPVEEIWFELSQDSFVDRLDERPIFHMYGERSTLMDKNPKCRLKKELHDYLMELPCDYILQIAIHPENFNPYMRCYITKISDDVLLMLKLSHDVIIERYKDVQ